MHVVSARRDSRRFAAVVSASLALAFVAVFAFAARAQAENIYWDNYTAEPATISFAGTDGIGGGSLNLSGATLESPEGMAYDTVTNRLFVGSSHPEKSDLGEIFYVNLDGSGSGVLATPGAPVEEPEGVVVDPATRMIYWTNTAGNGEADGSIGFAHLDGSGGGMLNTAGATLSSPYKIALDPVAGIVYWANSGGPSPETISWANVNGSGGGNLDLTGAPAPQGITGFSVDPAGGRIYWLDNSSFPKSERVGYASLSGGGGGEVNLTGATFGEDGIFNDPFGLAFDPSMGRLYWGNYDQEKSSTNAIGYVNLAGGVGGITPASAPVNGPQDPVIIKSPSGTGAPAITRNPKLPAELSCSTGSWGADFAGSFVYQAPRSFAYQWSLNGVVLGSGPERITATAPGSYTCTVTAVNQTGSATQTSGAVTVKASKVKLTVKPRTAKAKAGGVATFNVKALNQGELPTKNAKLCVKVPKKAKKALKAPKCKSLGKVGGLKKKTTKLKVKLKPSAEGSYKIKIQVKGTAGKVVNATIKVVG
jgi:hypothetical protein